MAPLGSLAFTALFWGLVVAVLAIFSYEVVVLTREWRGTSG